MAMIFQVRSSLKNKSIDFSIGKKTAYKMTGCPESERKYLLVDAIAIKTIKFFNSLWIGAGYEI